MQTTLPLEKGEILLTNQKITIRDSAKKEKLMRIASSGIWTFYGVISVLRYTKTGDEFLLWSGTIIGSLHFLMLVYTLFITPKSEVSLHEISKATFKTRFGNHFLDLKLKSGSKRRISKVAPVADELKAFFEEHKIAVH